MASDLAFYESIPAEALRDRVMDDLVKHYSLERIGLDEFERRTGLVSRAATRGDMLAQVSDLPPLPAEDRAPRGRGEGRAGERPAEWRSYRPSEAEACRPGGTGPRSSDVSVAIFGGSDFRGVWRAPRKLDSLSLFGGTNIDLRKAIVPREGMTISCLCLFGGVDVIVPPGMRVVVRGMGVFGGFDRTSNEVDDPDAPTILVEGLAFFGGVSIKIKD
jgi:hypothetical protein